MQQQPQHLAQQMAPQKSQGMPVQRVSTPVDPALTGSSSPANSNGTHTNQARQQTSMSPNQKNLQLQNQQQQQQGQIPQQQPPVAPQILVPQQQQMQQQQPHGQTTGRSPTPMNAGTPMVAGPNPPAPRPGSAQFQHAGRPKTTTNTPAHLQQPPPQQQQRQFPSGQLPLAARATAQRGIPRPHHMPIPVNLPLPPPAAISIPPGRPSLTGGANNPANSVLGTPAVIKKAAFEFGEGGTGLLSKRKLEELVKQIDPEEKLDPDVEEVSKLTPLLRIH